MHKGLKLLLLIFLFPFIYLQGWGQPGLEFKENKGQWEPQVQFAAALPNGQLFITNEGLTFDICEPVDFRHKVDGTPAPTTINCHAFKLNFNQNILPESIIGNKSLSTRYNYLKGPRDKWAKNVRAFREIWIEFQPGLSMKIHSEGRDVKYDIHAADKSLLEGFEIEYEGVEVEKDLGNLKLSTSIGELIESIPLAYAGESRDNIPCEYLVNGNRVKYRVGDQIAGDIPIVVDPILVFSTYSGSTADNWGSTATFDANGNLYSGGISSEYLQGNYPTSTGAYQLTNRGAWDVAIAKYDSTGSQQVYSTLLGGFSSEMVQSLIVNSKNELVILGITSSTDFPTTSNAYQSFFAGGERSTPFASSQFGTGGVVLDNGTDIFVSVLSPDGTELVGSTFLGGSRNDGVMDTIHVLTKNYGDQSRGDVYVDDNDNIFIASKTESDDFPVVNGFQATMPGDLSLNGVVVKMTPDASDITWSTLVGGSADDAVYSIKTNKTGQIVVAGGTTSTDFHANMVNTLAGGIDGWTGIISEDGTQFITGRYMGTPEYDQAYFVDLDSAGNIYCYGQTAGDYPEVGNVFTEGDGQFIQKFSPDLSQALISTNFGSILPGPDISPTAFLVNDCANIYVAGWGGEINSRDESYVGGSTFNLPVTMDAYQPVTTGRDFYLAVFVDDAANLLYATFLGGGQSQIHVDGGTSRFDSRGLVYHAVCAGCGGFDNDFPPTQNAWSRTNNSPNCNNAAFKFDLSSLRAGIQANTTDMLNPGIGFVCLPDSLVFENLSIGGAQFLWDFGDGRKINTTSDANVTHRFQGPGNYRVKLKIIDRSTCIEEDSTFVDIEVFEPQITLPGDDLLCEGESFNLQVSGTTSVIWRDMEGTVVSTQSDFTGTPAESIEYSVEAYFEQCLETDTLLMEVIPDEGIEASFERDCKTEREIQFFSETDADLEFYWDFGDGETSEEQSPVHVYGADGLYDARFIAQREHCEFISQMPINVYEINVPSVFTPVNLDTKNDTFQVIGTEEISLEVFNRWGRSIYFSENYQNDWTGDDVEAGTYYYLVKTENESVCKGWVQIIK